MKINAANEEIQKQNPERLDQDEQNGQKKQEDALDTSKLLSIEEAAKIAEKQAGGEQPLTGILVRNLVPLTGK